MYSSFGNGTTTSHTTASRTVVTRLRDALPGGLAWLALIAIIAGAMHTPLLVLAGVALLACYTAIRFGFAAVAVQHGLWQIRQWEHIDWHAEYTQRQDQHSLPLDAVQHLVIIPSYGENITLLRRTLDALAAQDHALTQITVVLAMEAAESDAQIKGAQLRNAYADRFAHVWVTLHPPNLPGERQCKSANLAWALREARRRLIDEKGYDPAHVLVTAMDADTLWHPQYFASLTVLFATDPKRYHTYWQAPIRYHANVWQTHPLLRILHAYASAWELAYLAAPWWRALPMSSYALSLRLLDETGAWDGAVIADEWHMFIKSYFARSGEQRLQQVYLPFHTQATGTGTLRDALRERYRQTFRHAWGAKEIGYTLAQMAQHPHIPRTRTWGLLLRVAHDNLLAGAGWIVLFLGAQLPLLFHPDTVRQHLTSAPVLLFQASILVISVLTIWCWWLDRRLRPPRPHTHTRRDTVLELLSVPLLAVLTVIGVALPVLHAQTRMMLGKDIVFRVTPKM
ncbi:MAG: glycosyltransferase family 2 protein [Anaerolineae bacterium]|nr:glycosyltransferase family 2 protein [Anaerolineae bacterium]